MLATNEVLSGRLEANHTDNYKPELFHTYVWTSTPSDTEDFQASRASHFYAIIDRESYPFPKDHAQQVTKVPSETWQSWSCQIRLRDWAHDSTIKTAVVACKPWPFQKCPCLWVLESSPSEFLRENEVGKVLHGSHKYRNSPVRWSGRGPEGLCAFSQ